MKKNSICLFLFILTSVSCFFIGFLFTRKHVRIENAIPNATIESQTVPDAAAVLNQQEVEPVTEPVEGEFYLVSEDGFLLVFRRDQSTVCLYTHMPISDFPQKEQDKLREGIWFSNMIEIFNYLESYTS